MAEKARQRGLIALEPDAASTEHFLLRKGLDLVLSGTDSSIISRIMGNYIASGNYRGKELLVRCIILEGILSIQQGEHPAIIKEKMLSYFGEEYTNQYESTLEKQPENQLSVNSYIQKFKDRPAYSKACEVLEEPLRKLDTRSLQRLIREIDIYDLVSALKGVSGSIMEKVLQCMPKNLSGLLIHELEKSTMPNSGQIVDSQRKIIEIIQKLRNEGDIK